MKMEHKVLLLCLIFAVSFVFSQNPCDKPSRFTCNDGTCISIARTCNGKRDCPHGEDESSGRANCRGEVRRCARRDDEIALSNGYKCKRSCNPDVRNPCKSPNKKCVCDDECGFSCINPYSPCVSDLPEVANSTGSTVLRFNGTDLVGVSEEDNFRLGDMIRYSCPHQMRLTGPHPRCNGKTRTWTQEIPQCVDAVCHDPPPQVNGAVSYHFLRNHHVVSVQEGAILNDLVTYKCRKELILIGEAARCDSNRQWTSQTQRCIVPCPPRGEPWEIEELGLTCGPECYTTEDCQPGLECSCDGACGRACVNMSTDCGNATEVAFSTLNYTGEGIKRVARYKCDEGYYLASGRLSLRCTGSGRWVGDIPVCEAVYCSNPIYSIEATSGDMIGSSTRYGSTVEFSCRSNYRMFGARFRTCMGNAQWSGELTVCDLIDNEDRCPHPGVPINGRLEGRDFSVGASVTFSCDSGYILFGEAEQTCLWFLQWSGDRTPKCINPRYPHFQPGFLQTLTRSMENLPDQELNVARFISQSDTGRGHEIYFMIDVSKSVLKKQDDLKDEIEFAKRLVKRMERFDGNVNYAIMVFASKNVTAMDIAANVHIPTTEKVIGVLDEVYKKAISDEYKETTKSGTATGYALNKLKDMLAEMWNNNNTKENMRHVFIFTDGQHTEGDDPVDLRKEIEQEFMPNIEFYSITACKECNAKAFEELQGLSSKKGENYIYIEDFYLLSEYLDKVTNVTLDFGKCGQAGEVGSIKKQAQLARVVGGDDATDTAWPWQALVTRRVSKLKDVFQKKQMLGGGSLLNNHWVLTAAHLFGGLKGDGDWAQDIIVSLGIFERPSHVVNIPKSVRMFIPERIITHENFNDDVIHSNMEHDIALIKLGKELDIEHNLDEIEADGVEYSYYIRPVCLPCTGTCLREDQLVDNKGESLLQDGITEEKKCQVEEGLLQSSRAKAVVTGFGHLNISRPGHVDMKTLRLARKLQQGLLQIVDRPTCEAELGKINEGFDNDKRKVFTDNIICCKSGKEGADEIDACQGDSGGPLVREVLDKTTKETCWVQIGIVSWGYGCALGHPAYYTNVARYIPWIDNITHILQKEENDNADPVAENEEDGED